MEYTCYSCGKTLTYEDIMKRIRCPYCGGKIIFKKRPEIVKRVRAR